MHQVLQNTQTDATTLETVPPPAFYPGAGAEKVRIDLAQKSYPGKAGARSDLTK